MSIVTRFAPSPTGHLHIGGARTAIFSWLLARSEGGRFLLRIEDTDRARSSQEMTDAILDSMRWLGLDWDGEPIFQSDRSEIYNAAIDRMLAEGTAYWCECTPEEVEAMRERARAVGAKPKYDGRCRERGLGPGEGRVVRFKGPLTGKTLYDDLVLGTVAVDNAELDDMILRRPDGSPTYNLAVVVDDNAMGVTHVLRGDDHVNNTPRQILLYRALGFAEPRFGHVPLIHGQDKKKLSKRHGAVSVMEYERAGYLPEALLNYLVRLGWASGDQEIFSREELIALFDTAGFSKSAAAFDQAKLDWLNSHYIQNSAPDRLAPHLGRFLAERGRTGVSLDTLTAIAALYQPRAKTLVEMAEQAEFFVMPDAELEYDEKAVAKFLTPEVKEHLVALRALFATFEPFEARALEAAVQAYLDERELKFKVVAQPIRVAVTGRTFSPGLFETVEVLGRESTLARLDRAIALIG
ncbi:MAG: glutamate--tRNA ligase [Desulfovibrionaceae bacterium]|jgi:glutamyl-tRNA synthetase|nr:glutamate--tRNA ligase [Desulfovibrionaceae bacterium]